MGRCNFVYQSLRSKYCQVGQINHSLDILGLNHLFCNSGNKCLILQQDNLYLQCYIRQLPKQLPIDQRGIGILIFIIINDLDYL